jgi:hypothetical protein
MTFTYILIVLVMETKTWESIDTQWNNINQQKDNSSLRETLWEWIKDYVITYRDMNQIIKKHYEKKW